MKFVNSEGTVKELKSREYLDDQINFTFKLEPDEQIISFSLLYLEHYV